MIEQAKILCTILGSFKFKKEIDLVREELEDNKVTVLAPEKGSIYIPPSRRHILIPSSFRPLPSEKNKPIKQVENNFLRNIGISNFTYLVDIDGYVGPVVSMEMGFTIAREIPLYAKEKININLDPNPEWKERVEKIPVMTPAEALKDFQEKNL
ncbi:MAG: MazG nucleotide pyrophosphohydrolase [Candidatus Shapirobacteria bacterium GW2011_GWE1_38_10]|uniref:MazG nucleotide pyrophosphohydrolase n=1 Tax=Candidatus Shapirobacteria bacterium GW2011_GWE1_38_10 TaxID=1618488 RepID=A0A0G0LCN2_9BACT|nr:MAG: MazG nucleotide pyrophosphohydrolase [Candidatus Shapirobacteria bacterium GW2011_GWF2_37_20]KKQ50411.1 MAG: MazG nucleotide pyrophosphohydrolase [Candidatus Shapirobacteria bacterium GW2011_GWE1_38_10]KKQ65235.1 MAG: MazG nucleotide pyrophosphohydrolase [Candidatus Shapirobacteria bacterium GW2011_GWF1_38_23]HBP51189.1 hypothetical protein [Candidatus Shapirobacteria bacterium]